MALCSFTGDACLPGLSLLPESAGPNLQRQLCRQRGAVPTFCHSCPGAPVDKTAAHCALWGTGRMQWDAAEVSAPGPGPDDLCNRSSLAFVAPRANGACARPLPLRSDALRLLGGQTIAFVGDSLMRQVFTRTVAWMRGQSTLADPAFHSDGAARLVGHPRPPTHFHAVCAVAALYLATGEQDALVPLFPAYGAACALELADGKAQSLSCQAGLQHELHNKGLRADLAAAIPQGTTCNLQRTRCPAAMLIMMLYSVTLAAAATPCLHSRGSLPALRAPGACGGVVAAAHRSAAERDAPGVPALQGSRLCSARHDLAASGRDPADPPARACAGP